MIPLANQWLNEAGTVLGRGGTPDRELGSGTPWCVIELWTVQKFKMLPSSFLSFLHEGSDLYHILKAPQISSGSHPHFLSQAFCLRSFFHILFWLLLPREHTSWYLTSHQVISHLLSSAHSPLHPYVKTYCQETWYDVSYFRLLLPVTSAYWNISICGLQLFAPDKESVDFQKPFGCPMD